MTERRAVGGFFGGSVVLLAATLGVGCGQSIDVGSDLIWTARFETGGLDEWTGIEGGATTVTPGSSALVVSNEQARHGSFAAKMTITTSSFERSLSTLDRNGGLPDQGYYSAWFHLPQAVVVENSPFQQYWSIMRFRAGTAPADPNSMRILYDLNLESLASGDMVLRVFDVGQSQDAPMIEGEARVPIGRWFHLEAFYRNAPDADSRLTVWLDGAPAADLANAASAPGSVGWSVANVGVDLSPRTVSLYVDDCAVSRTRVGPEGQLE